MNTSLRIALDASPEQAARLAQLQAAFAGACNALAPLVHETRVWNRVALHHMGYRLLRERFPDIGSQMACNAIYSVSRHCRLLFQSPGSPFNIARLGDRPLPLLRFSERAPVYFDRHTLSLKAGQLSLYTLDGRMRFQLALRPQDEAAFHGGKLREIVLARAPGGRFELSFVFSEQAEPEPEPEPNPGPATRSQTQVPEYMMVED